MKKSKLSKFQSERLNLNKAQKLVGGAIEVTIKTDSNKKEAPKEELVQIVINMEESDRFTINI
jgi:hypothetical protein